MKYVLQKMAQIEHQKAAKLSAHNVQLGDAQDLAKAVNELADLIDTFGQKYDAYAKDVISSGGPVWNIGDEIAGKYSKVVAMGTALQKQIVALGLNPDEVQAFQFYEEFQDNYNREKADIADAMDNLENVAGMLQG